MRSRIGVLATLAAAVALVAPQPASAATEFGDNCTGDSDFPSPNVTLFERVAPGNPLSPSAPSAGVITKLKVTVVPVPFGFSQTIKVLRLNTGAKTALITAEVNASLSSGQNVLDARIPVQAGDVLSLYGPGEPVDTLICVGAGGGGQIGGFLGNGGGVNSTVTYEEAESTFRIPVAAVLEPDADNDGFGDETQDKCPQSATTQAECPVIVLDSFPLAKKSSIVVLVSTGESAPVTVSGTATFPKPAKRASASAKAKLKKVTKTVPAGKLVRFKLKLPGSLRSALKGLPRGKSATVRLTATATDVAGRKTKDKAKLRLRGLKGK